MVNKGKRYDLIQQREEINKLLEKLTVFEKQQLFQRMQDIFYLYHYSPEDVKNFLRSSGELHDLSGHQLLNLEGVVNALLFQLKYKRK